MTFRPITIRTTTIRNTDSRLRTSPAKRAVRVIQGLQQKLSPLRRKIRDDVEVTAPMRPAPRGPALKSDVSLDADLHGDFVQGEPTHPETRPVKANHEMASARDLIADADLSPVAEPDVFVPSAS